MRRSRLAVCVVLLASAVAVVPAAIAAGPPPQAAAGLSHRPVCGPPVPGTAHCHAHVVTRSPHDPTPAVSASPTGLSPTDIATAYNFPTGSTLGTGKTIAIVDAYDLPSAASDLNTFGAAFGVPVCAG